MIPSIFVESAAGILPGLENLFLLSISAISGTGDADGIKFSICFLNAEPVRLVFILS
jgi:hypothetical protein